MLSNNTCTLLYSNNLLLLLANKVKSFILSAGCLFLQASCFNVTTTYPESYYI